MPRCERPCRWATVRIRRREGLPSDRQRVCPNVPAARSATPSKRPATVIRRSTRGPVHEVPPDICENIRDDHGRFRLSTVSLALKHPGRVKASTLERVLAVADDLGSVPQARAVVHARRGLSRVAAIAPFTSNPSFRDGSRE